MNKNRIRLSFPVIILLLASCSPASQPQLTPAATPGPVSTAPLTLTQFPTGTPGSTPSPTDTPTAAPSPTDAPTPTPSRPVFDPAALGDNRVLLASFILTSTEKTTGGGEVIATKDIIGYIREPFSAYHIGKMPSRDLDATYMIDGWFYEQDINQNFWVVSPEQDPSDVDFFLKIPADMRWVFQTGFDTLSAQFVGQEVFHGIPANHFTFDQSDLNGGSDPTGTYKVEKASGDLLLAQAGNYLLRYHLKLSGNLYSPPGSALYGPGTREFTEELSSINQLTEITLPPEVLAFKLVLDLGLPVPTGSRLHAISHFNDVPKYDYYDYFMPASVSKADFLDFYKNLAPTNGWTVSQVGGKTSYDNCQDRDCVILKKGSAHLVVAISPLCVSNIPANYICFDASYYR